MDESRQIAIIVILGLALAVVGIAATSTLKGFGTTGPAVVSSYEAHFMNNGTLKEDYTYTLHGAAVPIFIPELGGPSLPDATGTTIY